MISVLTQERLLGVALGAVFAGVFVFEQRQSIYQTIMQHEDKQPAAKFEVKDSIPRGRHIRHLWNEAMDQTLGPVISYLSSRGWLNGFASVGVGLARGSYRKSDRMAAIAPAPMPLR